MNDRTRQLIDNARISLSQKDVCHTMAAIDDIKEIARKNPEGGRLIHLADRIEGIIYSGAFEPGGKPAAEEKTTSVTEVQKGMTVSFDGLRTNLTRAWNRLVGGSFFTPSILDTVSEEHKEILSEIRMHIGALNCCYSDGFEQFSDLADLDLAPVCKEDDK